MTEQAHQHHHPHRHAEGTGRGDEAGLADVLDLDADVLGSYLDEVVARVGQYAPAAPRTIVDVGAGTGAGSLALAQRYRAAEVVAIDSSALMVGRLRRTAAERGLADRLRVVQADVDATWPAISAVDLVWAASSLHHVADPDRVLRAIRTALNPGGLLVVVEMDGLPRFLPEDVGLGRPGLETRLHEAAAQAGWNAHPDWRPHLERAGFELAEKRRFTVEVSAAPPNARRYAHELLSRMRPALGHQSDGDDEVTLDRLLADHLDTLAHRGDLTIRNSRTAWISRRP